MAESPTISIHASGCVQHTIFLDDGPLRDVLLKCIDIVEKTRNVTNRRDLLARLGEDPDQEHDDLALELQQMLQFVFTPKHGRWLNMVEGFFSKMTRQMLRGIRVKTKDELRERIYKYFEAVKREPVVYHWKYRFEDVDVSEEVAVDTLPLKGSS